MTHTPAPDAVPQDSLPPGTMRKRPRHRRVLDGLGVVLALYFFIGAINLMGHGLKTVAKNPAADTYLRENVFSLADQPLAGLAIGVLVTALVQSSSFTTVFVVGLVASGQLSLAAAIPIIMGANVGTSVTNLLVSLANVRNRLGFRRALAAAVVHDIFNVLSVILLLPLELAFGLISRPAAYIANSVEHSAFFTTDPKKFDVVKYAVQPLSDAAEWFFQGVLHLSDVTAGAMTAVLALLILFAALIFLVQMLQGLMKERLSGLFDRTLFRNPATSFAAGLIATVMVQSSSVTTSLAVPLVAAGVLKIRQIYPYTLGANIGTTITAILAAFANAALNAGKGEAAMLAAAGALGVAFGHLTFNVLGTCVFWPLQWIPISLAKGYAKLAARRRALAAVYILVVFIVVPILMIVLVNL